MSRAENRLRVGIGALFLGLAGAACGQNQWLFDVRYSDPAGVINSLDDTATVYLWAKFAPEMYAYHRGKIDVTADDLIDGGIWSDPVALLLVNGPGTFAGSIEGETVAGIITTQLHFPPNLLADASNPIVVWKATWRPSILHPRLVPVETATGEFSLYDWFGGWHDLTDSVVEGQGLITVVPAPVSGAVFLIIAFEQPVRRRRGDRASRPEVS